VALLLRLGQPPDPQGIPMKATFQDASPRGGSSQSGPIDAAQKKRRASRVGAALGFGGGDSGQSFAKRPTLRLFTQEAAQRREEERKSTTKRRGAILHSSWAPFKATGIRPRTAAAAELIAKKIRGEHLHLRERAFLMLEEPSSSLSATLISFVVRLVTLAATVVTLLESLDWVIEDTGQEVWDVANYVFFVLFLVEACVRVSCYVPFHNVIFDPFIWLDVLTVVPFIVRISTSSYTTGGLGTVQVREVRIGAVRIV
jgi:hypothetical protein